MKPLCIELFAGTFGWGAGFIAEGFDVIGFDIMDVEKEFGVSRTKGCQLVLQDVLTLDGSQFRNADCIVASPPCQEFSYYHRFPWKAPQPSMGISLFNRCFEIAAQAGCPLVVENVVGAQRWVGPAVTNYGSFYLWGDIPALMPITLSGDGRKGFGKTFEETPWAWYSSRSIERKKASAELAKIPFALASHIAIVYKP